MMGVHEETDLIQETREGKLAVDLHAPRTTTTSGHEQITNIDTKAKTLDHKSAVNETISAGAVRHTATSNEPEFDIPNSPHEIRRDYIFEEYVIIAPGRHKRPFDFRVEQQPLIETASSPQLSEQPIIDTIGSNTPGKDWDVRSVANIFPTLNLDNPLAYGSQEIIIDTPLSNMPMARLSPEDVCEILSMYQRRLKALKRVPHIKYVQLFKNEGRHAGASLAHSHTQIFALPLIPPRFVHRSEAVSDYITQKSSNPYDDIIAFELKAKQRVIEDNSVAISICPYASAWPLEAWLLPKRHMQSFDEASHEELIILSKMLLKILRKLEKYQFNFNFFIEEGIGSDQRWVFKLYGRDIISPLGGLEVSTGVVINSLPPEVATQWYRK